MKRIINTITWFVLLASICACNDWLDETPPSQIPEQEQFKDETGFRQALMGCYIGMAKEALYGKNLTWYALELQDAKYELNTMADWAPMATYSYKSSSSVSILEEVWLEAYNIVANVNNALKFMETNGNVLNPVSYKVIKGELMAIRAMLHFDLMRLYGYGNLGARTDKNSKLAIPYVKDYSKEMTEQKSYKETINLIIADLKEAIDLLKDEDPITGKHDASYYSGLNEDGFYSNRTWRLNYFAVKALLARVYMWEGSDASLALARKEALDVIEEGEKASLYTWVTSETIGSNLILSTEHIASLNVLNLSDKILNFFKLAPANTDYSVIMLSESGMNSIFSEEGEGTNADFRGSVRMLYPTSNGYYVPLKLSQNSTTAVSGSLNRIPLMRIPEMFLIVAETYLKGTDVNTELAVQYLTVLREKRSNFINISTHSQEQLLTCLTNEYRREFLCEGVSFLYFKRIGAETLPNSLTTMSDAAYVWPYPAIELEMGLVQ